MTPNPYQETVQLHLQWAQDSAQRVTCDASSYVPCTPARFRRGAASPTAAEHRGRRSPVDRNFNLSSTQPRVCAADLRSLASAEVVPHFAGGPAPRQRIGGCGRGRVLGSAVPVAEGSRLASPCLGGKAWGMQSSNDLHAAVARQASPQKVEMAAKGLTRSYSARSLEPNSMVVTPTPVVVVAKTVSSNRTLLGQSKGFQSADGSSCFEK